jgi:hypothetical protein
MQRITRGDTGSGYALDLAVVADETPQGLLERTGAVDVEHAFLALAEGTAA